MSWIVRFELPTFVSVTVPTDPPFDTDKRDGTSFTLPVVNVTTAVADLAGFVDAVATTVTLGFKGSVSGAVYVVACPSALVMGETVPHVGEQATESWVSDQSTSDIGTSYCTRPLKACFARNGINALAGVTPTVAGGTVTVADPTVAGELTDAALRVTSRSASGDDGGAVYVTCAPLADVVGATDPHSSWPHWTVQETPFSACSA
jgi:hypothetical protein